MTSTFSKELQTKIKFGMLLTTNEVAEIFDMYPGTVLSWAHKGMPYIRMGSDGSAFRYDIRKIIFWIRDNKVKHYRRFIDRYGSDIICHCSQFQQCL